MLSSCKKERISVGPTLVEALEVRWSLELARSQQWRKVVIQTNALMVAYCIHRKYYVTVLKNVIDNCISLLSAFNYVTFHFIRRDRNLEAHKLIGLTLNVGSKT